MDHKPVLLTGFEPYGGRGINPAAEVVTQLDGCEIEGHRVVGRLVPVSFARLRRRIEELVRDTDPAAVVSLGLWPGEPVIRIERVAVNIADFEIPDNDGMLVVDGLVTPAAAVALASTLPLRAVERALLQAGVPARLSTTAGTFLCNATLYSALQACGSAGPRCGFVHLPYLPEQVASLLSELRKGQTLELHQRADLASMSLATMVQAVRIVVAVSLTTTAEGVA